MEFRTIVDLPSISWELQPKMKLMCIGSCFSQEIGKRIKDALPADNVMLNPNGVQYNPYCIGQFLKCLINNDCNIKKYIFKGRDGLYHSWLHTSLFSCGEENELERNLKYNFSVASCFFAKTDVLILTWGTSHIYIHQENNMVVSNCHKEPANDFVVQRLSVDDIQRMYVPLFEEMHRINPNLQIVITISPYRYSKYGFNGSNNSKAVLLLASEQLCRQYDYVDYFPAYEILKDELRDYRFYGADMLHPSEQAVEYIWERFQKWCFSKTMEDYAREKKRIQKAHQHIILNKQSIEYKTFRKKLEEMDADFRNKWGMSV